MAYLAESLQADGVLFEEKTVARIDDQLEERVCEGGEGGAKYDVVVNCTGLGALGTEGDASMFPIRGQVLRVAAPWVKTSCTFGAHYVIPNVDSLVIGGTGQRGDWSTAVSAEDSRSILEGVCRMFPSLALAELLETNVGLRPCRPSVRLDSEVRQRRVPCCPGRSDCGGGAGAGGGATDRGKDTDRLQLQLLVRCYGLGGSGYTLGPGVAVDVVRNHIGPYIAGRVPLLRRLARL
jgi:hypothetical protein